MIAAVIGAGWGDEGKGLCVDFMSTHNTLVVRHSGGAQAGHTVVTPEGLRHVFHQFGSGTLRGADTLLSRFMLVNPILFVSEWKVLSSLYRTPINKVLVDRRAPITTPFDMWINRAAENSRGQMRHGSCGLGIHETVLRSESPDATLTVDDLIHAQLRDKLFYIQNEYMPKRCEQLGVEIPALASAEWAVSRFLQDITTFLSAVTLVHDSEAIREWPHVVFEGAQGLRLDEVHGEFPHVTHARTGLTNVEILTRGWDIDPIEVYYVTRCYTTRHGAGPLPGEVQGHPFGWTGNETNVTNDYQGAFRYARLDVIALEMAIIQDISAVDMPIKGSLAVTCLDQMPANTVDVAVEVLEDLTVPLELMVSGPTRNHVRCISKVKT